MYLDRLLSPRRGQHHRYVTGDGPGVKKSGSAEKFDCNAPGKRTVYWAQGMGQVSKSQYLPADDWTPFSRPWLNQAVRS